MVAKERLLSALKSGQSQSCDQGPACSSQLSNKMIFMKNLFRLCQDDMTIKQVYQDIYHWMNGAVDMVNCCEALNRKLYTVQPRNVASNLQLVSFRLHDFIRLKSTNEKQHKVIHIQMIIRNSKMMRIKIK